MGLMANIGRGICTAGKQFGQGFAAEGKVAVSEAGQAVKLARRSFSGDDQVRAAQRAELEEVREYVADNPGPTLRSMGSSLVTPIKDEIKAGRPAAAAGRGAVLLAGAVLPGVGSEKLMRLLAAARSQAAEGASTVARSSRP